MGLGAVWNPQTGQLQLLLAPAFLLLQEAQVVGGHAQGEEEESGVGGGDASGGEAIADARPRELHREHVVERRYLETHAAAGPRHAPAADAELDVMAAVSPAMPGWGMAEDAAVQNVGTGADDGGRRPVDRT